MPNRTSAPRRPIAFMLLSSPMKPIRLFPSWLLGIFFATLFLGPFDAYALEKYGRPLPSMKKAGEKGQAVEEAPVVSGYWLTAAFPYNPTFAARPDNTGLVGMRHMLHLEADLYKQYLTFYTDQNFFSDRTNGWIELSEWDGTYAFTGAVDRFNWRMQYERDAPLDRSGIIPEDADGLGRHNYNRLKSGLCRSYSKSFKSFPSK